MRMTKANTTVSDKLLDRARAAGLNVSRLVAAALVEEIERRAKIAEPDAYLAALGAGLGPVPGARTRRGLPVGRCRAARW